MLYIWIPLGLESWRFCNSSNTPSLTTNNAIWQTADNLEQLITATSFTKNKEVTAFFPSLKTQLITKKMAEKQYKKMGEIGLRYIIEEYTLAPIELIDIRKQYDAATETLTLLSVQKSDIEQYTKLLAIGNWHIQALLPDFLLLPTLAQTATLYIDKDKRLLRLNEFSGLAAEDLSIVLPRLSTDINALQVIGQPSSQDRTILEHSELTVSQQPHLLQPSISVRHPFNMLIESTKTGLPVYWKIVSIVLLAAIGMQLAYDGIRLYQNKHITKTVRAQSENHFKQWFPDERPRSGLALKKQIESHLKSTNTSTTDAIVLINRVAPILSQNNVFATTVNYQQGTLEATLSAPNMQVLDLVKSQLSDQGLKVTLSEANAKGTEAMGTIKVQL